MRLIQLADIGDGEFRDRSARFVTSQTVRRLNCTLLEEGYLLIARMPDPLGRACIFPGVGQPAITAFDVFVWRPSSGGSSARWLMHFVNSRDIRARIAEQAGGTTRQRIAGGRIKQLEIPVPPLTEQRRIVAKIDSLSGKSNRARGHLDHIPRLVEKYKQAILTAAFRGDLTRTWRIQRSIPPCTGPHDYADLELDDVERGQWSTNILPDSWEWRGFGQLFTDVTDSNRKLPQKAYQAKGKYPVIDQGEQLIGGYSDDYQLVHTASPPFIIFGDHTRCVKFFSHQFVQGADGVKVFKTTVGVDPAFGRYALLAANLPDKGYSRHMKFVRATFFPVPTLAEQQEIVRRIEFAFVWIGRFASQTLNTRKLVDHLDQSVLAKAFRGELLPQDPSDEPAKALLERIKGKDDKAPSRPLRRRTRSAKPAP